MVAFSLKKIWFGVYEYAPVPPGMYRVEVRYVTYIRVGPTKRLRIELKILNGEYANRPLRDNIFFRHPTNIKCVSYGYFRFNTMLKAMGVSEIKDTDELVGKQFLITVNMGIHRDKHGAQYNVIHRYDRLKYANPNQEFARPLDEVSVGVTDGTV